MLKQNHQIQQHLQFFVYEMLKKMLQMKLPKHEAFQAEPSKYKKKHFHPSLTAANAGKQDAGILSLGKA